MARPKSTKNKNPREPKKAVADEVVARVEDLAMDHDIEHIEDQIEAKSVEADTIDPSEPSGSKPVNTEPVDVDPVIEDVSNAPKATRNGGFLPLLIGGAVAAGVGFGAAQFLGNDRWPFQTGPSLADELAITVEAQRGQIAGLQSELADLQSRTSEFAAQDALTNIEVGIEDLASSLESTKANLSGVDQRLVDLENRPIPDVGATAEAVATYERELTAMREMFQTELVRIETDQKAAVATGNSAAQQAQKSVRRALIAQLNTSLDNGTDVTETLTKLLEAGIDVPQELVSFANTGIPTLGQLQTEFPFAARAALDTSIRVQVDEGETTRFSAFLRTQLGTRSLQPKEGTDPDAVLSRAEFALRSGDIDAALIELEALPTDAQKDLASWTSSAKLRSNAVSAVAAIVENTDG